MDKNKSSRLFTTNWVSDYLHEILGYSETSVEQYVVKLAKNQSITEPETIFERLIDQMDFPAEHPKLREFSRKLFE